MFKCIIKGLSDRILMFLVLQLMSMLALIDPQRTAKDLLVSLKKGYNA